MLHLEKYIISYFFWWVRQKYSWKSQQMKFNEDIEVFKLDAKYDFTKIINSNEFGEAIVFCCCWVLFVRSSKCNCSLRPQLTEFNSMVKLRDDVMIYACYYVCYICCFVYYTIHIRSRTLCLLNKNIDFWHFCACNCVCSSLCFSIFGQSNSILSVFLLFLQLQK